MENRLVVAQREDRKHFGQRLPAAEPRRSPAPHAVFFYFRNDMLVAWQVITPPRLREQVAKSLIAQYGQPIVNADDHATWTGQTTDLDFVGTAGAGPHRGSHQGGAGRHEADREIARARRGPK